MLSMSPSLQPPRSGSCTGAQDLLLMGQRIYRKGALQEDLEQSTADLWGQQQFTQEVTALRRQEFTGTREKSFLLVLIGK